MTASTPADLAVAFRSFGRRLSEAHSAAEDEDRVRHTEGVAADVYALLADVAPPLHVTPRGDVTSLGAAIADAIEAIPATAWDAHTLEELRRVALDAGLHLRTLDTDR